MIKLDEIYSSYYHITGYEMPRTFDALSQYGTCFRSNFKVQKAYEFFEFSRPKNEAYVVSILALSCSLNLLWIGDGQLRSLKRMRGKSQTSHKEIFISGNSDGNVP